MSTSENPPVSNRVSASKSPNRGCAPLIRKLKLDYPELSEGKIAKRVGCAPSNVHRVLKRFMGATSETELRQFQESQADFYDAVQYRALRSITDAKLVKSSAPALMMVAGTAFDKGQLLRGRPTSLNVTALLDVADMLRAKS